MKIPPPTVADGLSPEYVARWHADMAILEADPRTAGELPRPPRLVARVLAEARHRAKAMSTDPKVYLSKSEGRFRVIMGGVPLGPDVPTAEEALKAARTLPVSDRMWDGDRGEWMAR